MKATFYLVINKNIQRWSKFLKSTLVETGPKLILIEEFIACYNINYTNTSIYNSPFQPSW